MKNYVVAPYMKFRGEDVLGMFEENDFRVDKSNSINGTFEKTKSVKGTVNGMEIGIFNGDNNKSYVVFSDHTVKEL